MNINCLNEKKIPFFVFLSAIILFSCKKNCSPKITELIEIEEIYTTADSIIRFEFSAHDKDGDVIEIKLYINNQEVQNKHTNYISYDFEITNYNIGSNTFKVVATNNSHLETAYSSSFTIEDYRTPYLGEFRFITKQTSTVFGDPNIYIDTFSYDGNITNFKLLDSQSDYYPHDDSHENSEKKITINFLNRSRITPTITSDGNFIPKYGSHYYHSGNYSFNLDTITFQFYSGSLASSSNFTVIGVRN